MEIINQGSVLREDRNVLVIAHLTQYLDYITGDGGLLVPLALWLTMNEGYRYRYGRAWEVYC